MLRAPSAALLAVASIDHTGEHYVVVGVARFGRTKYKIAIYAANLLKSMR